MSESAYDHWLDAPYRAQGEREESAARWFYQLVRDALESLPDGPVTVPQDWSMPKKRPTMLDQYREWLCSYVEGVAEDTKEERRAWAEKWADREMGRE